MGRTSFGRYQLIEVLGRGGMGEVWRAHDTVTDRIVALKILPAELSHDHVFQQRFRREAHAAARLSSPHLIPIHTYGEINGRLYVDMRLIEGRDLQEELSRGPLPPERAVGIIDQIAKALHSAHNAGLLHRDVKPSNILLDNDDFAYLIDFGIARATGELALTAAGDVVGTSHYMAPERFGGSRIDTRADIYSLACVLYVSLAAQHPFPGDTLQEQITGHLKLPPPRPTVTNPGLPAGFDTVIAKGMAKNPDERYDTAAELARAAHEALHTPPRQGSFRAPSGAYGRGSAPARPDIYVPPRPEIRVPPPAPRPPAPRSPAPQPPPPQRMAPPPTPPPSPSPGPMDSPPTLRRPLPPMYPSPGREPPAAHAAEGAQPSAPAAQPPSWPPSRPWWRRKAVAIPAAVLIAVAATVTAMVMGGSGSESKEPKQVTLPFTDLREPQGLSVDGGGTVYVADTEHNRIMALPAGSSTPIQLPFKGLHYPTGVTADNTGTVYVNDAGNKRVVVLPSGSKDQRDLPFTELENPTGLSVDKSGTVYVADTAKNRVVALFPGSNTQIVLPFTDLKEPTGLVVNNGGTVYVADGGHDRVLALPPDSKVQEPLPFKGLKQPGGVTVDRDGTVYVNDTGNNRTLKLPLGATEQIELHFHGLDTPWGLAVANNGTVYVGGRNSQIVALQQ